MSIFTKEQEEMFSTREVFERAQELREIEALETQELMEENNKLDYQESMASDIED